MIRRLGGLLPSPGVAGRGWLPARKEPFVVWSQYQFRSCDLSSVNFGCL